MQPVRALTRRAGLYGLPEDRADNLTLAVNELAANPLRHSHGGGTLRIWHTPTELVCQITDQGWIEDPLAGRRPPVSDQGGQGLWLVNQLCDLVQRRSGPSGTTIGPRRGPGCAGRGRQHCHTGRSRPVRASLAVMLNAPPTSAWKVTATRGSPGAPGAISATSNHPSSLLRAVRDFSP
jgi:anti-sigma regulatory factor (Ser/Thr protein kinase)